MNIALIGYGRMGKTIERIALQRGHNIALRISGSNLDDFNAENLKQAEVAIEFSNPENAPGNVAFCLQQLLPVVSGTTGWNDKLQELMNQSAETGVPFLHSSNFSIGVNIFFEINKKLAQLMNDQPGYKAVIKEVHHLQKKDAPSGTAITLAEQIIAANNRVSGWKLSDVAGDDDLPVIAIREKGVPGTHTVTWSSQIDDIEITHTAHNRDGFALGAVLAAEFIIGKKGNLSMSDMLGL